MGAEPKKVEKQKTVVVFYHTVREVRTVKSDRLVDRWTLVLPNVSSPEVEADKNWPEAKVAIEVLRPVDRWSV